MKIIKALAVAISAAFFIVGSAFAQNVGTVTNHAVPVGKGIGKQGLTSIGPCTNKYSLIFAGASSDPACGQVDLAAGVTGTLPVLNGGTGVTTVLAALQAWGLQVPNLTHKASPVGADKIGFYDVAGTAYKYATLTELLGSIVSGVSSFNGATGVVTTSVVVQKFTATGTYTPTTGMKYANIECVGPGGGGGGVANGAANASASGAGGSGAWSRALVTAATVGASKAVTVGTGGAAGAAAAGNGGNGSGATSVGALCVANAGSGGTGVTSGAGAGIGGAGGSASGVGDLAYSGVPGASGYNSTIITVSTNSANGPSTPYGAGGKGAAASTAPGACNGWGGGGAAVWVSNSSGSIAGGAGCDGGVIITEYVQN